MGGGGVVVLGDWFTPIQNAVKELYARLIDDIGPLQ